MNKVFAVIGGQVFISQSVVEQAAQAIRKAVVMDCGTGELKFAEVPADDANEWLEKIAGQLLQSQLGAELRADIEKVPAPVDQGLLDQIREAAAKGAREGYLAVVEDLNKPEAYKAKADEGLANYVKDLGRMAGDDTGGDGKLFASDIGTGVAEEKPADTLWIIKVGVTPGGTFYCAGIGPA
ncbi:hypothetical protein [Pseudomonas oryzihabitans]|uniref:hypothetical protein n=1 Tax=Pseudomonas oryzihabitans TaxID=47885 RepID=UPI0011A0ED34|nr:hypothetical protein [Pseudomonas oryzihabitans]